MSKDVLKIDNGGIELASRKVKIFCGDSTWNTKIGYFLRNHKKVFISTYSLPDVEYIKSMFGKQGFENVTIIAHKKFKEKAKLLKETFPDIEIYLEDSTHEKVVLCEPDTIIIGSENFGHSGWREKGVRLKSKEGYDYLLKEYQERILADEKI